MDEAQRCSSAVVGEVRSARRASLRPNHVTHAAHRQRWRQRNPAPRVELEHGGSFGSAKPIVLCSKRLQQCGRQTSPAAKILRVARALHLTATAAAEQRTSALAIARARRPGGAATNLIIWSCLQGQRTPHPALPRKYASGHSRSAREYELRTLGRVIACLSLASAARCGEEAPHARKSCSSLIPGMPPS